MSDAIQKALAANPSPGFDLDWHGLINKCSAREEETFLNVLLLNLMNIVNDCDDILKCSVKGS
jgi:hypothetical protein